MSRAKPCGIGIYLGIYQCLPIQLKRNVQYDIQRYNIKGRLRELKYRSIQRPYPYIRCRNPVQIFPIKYSTKRRMDVLIGFQLPMTMTEDQVKHQWKQVSRRHRTRKFEGSRMLRLNDVVVIREVNPSASSVADVDGPPPSKSNHFMRIPKELNWKKTK